MCDEVRDHLTGIPFGHETDRVLIARDVTGDADAQEVMLRHPFHFLRVLGEVLLSEEDLYIEGGSMREEAVSDVDTDVLELFPDGGDCLVGTADVLVLDTERAGGLVTMKLFTLLPQLVTRPASIRPASSDRNRTAIE
jgi:hypothetical protein